MFVLIGISLSFESVRQKLIYYADRFSNGDELVYDCHNIKIPNKWVVHSKEIRNGKTKYILRKYTGDSTFIFVAIVPDYDSKIINHESLKLLSKLNIENKEYKVLELTALKPNNPTRFISKLSSEPIIIMSDNIKNFSELFNDAGDITSTISNTCN